MYLLLQCYSFVSIDVAEKVSYSLNHQFDAVSRDGASTLSGTDRTSDRSDFEDIDSPVLSEISADLFEEDIRSNSNNNPSLSKSSTAKTHYLESRTKSRNVPYSIGSDSEDSEEERKSGLSWKKGQPIGEGTFGQVFKGMNERTGELLALKQICLADGSEEEVESLRKEIRVMRRLDHVNIVRYAE